jgi:hypothetical protein
MYTELLPPVGYPIAVKYIVSYYIIKKVFLGKPDGRRKAGRPKLRWLDSTGNDLNTMVVKRWRKKAEDRWAVILKEVLVRLLRPDANKKRCVICK